MFEQFATEVREALDKIVPPSRMDRYLRFMYKAIEALADGIVMATSPFIIATLGIVRGYQKIVEIVNDHMEDEE